MLRAALAPALLSILCLPAGAIAQTTPPAAATAPAPAPKPKMFEGSAAVGFAQNRGNANSVTTNLTNKLKYRMRGWAVTQDLAFFYGEADDKVNANFWNGGLRGDRRLTSRLGAFVVNRFDRNVLQGIASRFEEGLGLDYKVVDTERDKLLVALGASAFQQRLTSGSTSQFRRYFPAARTALEYRHQFSPIAYFQQNAEYLPNLSDGKAYLVNTESAIVSPLIKRLAIKISYVVRYNAQPPIRDSVSLKRTDTFFASGLTYTF